MKGGWGCSITVAVPCSTHGVQGCGGAGGADLQSTTGYYVGHPVFRWCATCSVNRWFYHVSAELSHNLEVPLRRLAALWHSCVAPRHTTRDALEGKGPPRRPPNGLEEVAKAFAGGYRRLQIPMKLALGVRGQ